MMYFITTIMERDGDIKDTRCVGYLETYEKAEEIVLENDYDICETIYNYAVIEAIPSGIYNYDPNATWFKYNELEEKYYKCDTPEFAKNTIGFGIG